MSDNRRRVGFRNLNRGNIDRYNVSRQFNQTPLTPLMSNINDPNLSSINLNVDAAQNAPPPPQQQQHPHMGSNTDVVRSHQNRYEGSSIRGRNTNSNLSATTNNLDNRSFLETDSSNSYTPNQNSARKPSSITYGTLTRLLEKNPDEILAEMSSSKFQLKLFLNDKRMRDRYDWILAMTKLLERITECTDSRQSVAHILNQIPSTNYIEAVYTEVRKIDNKTNELPYDLIELFLKLSNQMLAIIPTTSDPLSKILERIELSFLKVTSKSEKYEEIKGILGETIDRKAEIDRRRQENLEKRKPKQRNFEYNEPPPDDYCQLPIVPNVNEILSDKKIFLRPNIVDGVYENARDYLDIHFRLLREDFVGPLRDGIEQHLSRAPGKNFNVRVYENVRLLGPRLSRGSGIVYDLFLDRTTATKISWANSRRLMYGNLVVLTFDNFKSCAFATVEDRKDIEQTLIFSVKKLEKLNNGQQNQIDLDEIDFSCQLTMIETMTYFEAYRPVLNALQTVSNDDTFPLEPFLLQLSKDMVPPNYVTPATTYDFTPLLVEPDSEVKSKILIPDPIQPRRHFPMGVDTLNSTRELRIVYKKSGQIPLPFKSVPLLDKSKWPTSDELHLNPKQRDALYLALTNKVALIQGPPGTGKTFLGVRIAEMLLYNRFAWCPPNQQTTPILMVCHTNHALDQFLELIIKRLNISEGIIRVGNRSQNPAIQPFSILNARRQVRENRAIPREVYHQKHIILDRKSEAEETLKIHEHKMEQSRTKIIPLSTFVDNYIISDKHLSSLIIPYNNELDDNIFWHWLGLSYGYEQELENLTDFGLEELMYEANIDDNKEDAQTTDQVDDHEEQNNSEAETKTEDQEQKQEAEMNEEEEEEQRRRDELDLEEEQFIPSMVLKPQTTTTSNPVASTDDVADDDQDGWTVVKKKPYDRRRLIQHIIECPTTITDETIQQQTYDDLWQLSMIQRYDLYRYLLLKYRQYLHQSVRSARQGYNQAIAELADYHQEEDYHILKNSIIVAMTTTCAAKYHNVLEKLQSKIIIVEEAAAIFEAHIVTALNTKCEHLILIGDHVQLRPNPSVYRLSTKYRIDVSLFERFVNNEFPNVRLNIQHRMRPEISALLKPFYDDLEDHISVKTERPPVRGVESNIYFISHSNMETSVPDGSSKRNDFEANYCIGLAQYLVKQSYRTDQITILVMYLGQRQAIARRAKNIKMLHGLRIMVTDNYQGEENDIIILSLVRSNSDNKIGFLKTSNRVCVALSRARCGFFVIGNMNLLSGSNELWKNIGKLLFDNKSIGAGLCLSCRQHSKEKFIANTPEAFQKRPEGGCDKPCDARLKCGHQCVLMCHNYDIEHKEIICRKKCNTPLSCGHPCKKQCHTATPDKHDPCRVLVEKTISTCNHKINFQCARTPTPSDCQYPILKRLPCDHPNNIPCRIISSPYDLKRFSCTIKCTASLACKHNCSGTCGTCRTGQLHSACQQKCERPLICSHICRAPCNANCPPCFQNCQTRCIHSQCKKRCGELCIPCKEPCGYKCEHLQCTRLCSEPCNRGPCNEPCKKKLKCGHDCIGMCGEPCPNKCRTCNKLVVQEIFFGTEDEPDARFVFLPDCKHLIEVTALDQFVQNSLINTNESKAIRFPECPRCKRQIRRCTRYMPIINEVHNLIEKVKKTILGNATDAQRIEKQNQLRNKFEKTQSNLKEVDLQSFENLFVILFENENLISDGTLILLKNILEFIVEIDSILIDGRKRLPIATFEDLVSLPLMCIIKCLSTSSRYRNLAEQQINDIQRELVRVRRVIFIEAISHSLKQDKKGLLKPDEKDTIDRMMYLTKKTGQFTKDDQTKFDGLAKKIEHLNNIAGLGITERERAAIVSALNMAQGHWYVCPKGHPYVITECGGAEQVSKCPECGEQIGGQNHHLIPTNRHFGLMDGSRHPAWSNEANLGMIPLNDD